MFGAIAYNLTHLFDFKGRDGRSTFWYYVLAIAILRFAIGFGISIPLIGSSIGNAVDAARSGTVDEQALTAKVVSGMGPWLETVSYIAVGMSLAMIVLLLAAFVRRVHDTGNSGWWAAIPLATQLFSAWFAYSNIGHIGEALDQAMQNTQSGAMMPYRGEMAGLGLIGWIGFIVVIGFGLMKSTEGPNEYGDAPVSF